MPKTGGEWTKRRTKAQGARAMRHGCKACWEMAQAQRSLVDDGAALWAVTHGRDKLSARRRNKI
ncbi:MAG: hypothetical protein DMF19_11885 [Verrucomicrobia bacterium]|nr:MAG: hypothetical protein DMF19_11885 [Verrucomicrobiota bacterium]